MFGHVHERRTLSVCETCASGVQLLQVGCCIVQRQVAHSVPIFLSVADAHGQPWTNNSNNSNNSYNSYKQAGAEALERQVDPNYQSGSGNQASSSSRVTTPKKPQVDEHPSNQPTEQPRLRRLQPHFPCKSELLVHHNCHMYAPLTDDSLEWRWLREVTRKYLYRRSLYRWLKKCR